MKNSFLGKIKTVTIIGVGLIGGSIGLALKQLKIKNEKLKIVGVGRHKDKLIKAKKIGVVDEWTTDFEKGVRDADLVIIATPVETIVPIVKKILPYLKPGAIITDVGSVKAPIVSGVETLLSSSSLIAPACQDLAGRHRSSLFVGGHPIAGSEKTGISQAKANLFKDKVCLLTPTKFTSRNALKTVSKFWQLLGARVLTLPPALHDRLLACSSHLPHLIAAGLINLIADNKNKYSAQVLGPSFRDLTRVASSEPAVWSEICLSNRKEIILALNKFIKILSKLEKKLKEGKNLKTFFQRAKDYRKRIFLPRR